MTNALPIIAAALVLGLAAALSTAAVSRWLRIRIDITPIEHALAAVAIQCVWAMSTGDWWGGAAIGIGTFIGREHAQAEYRYIDAHGGSRYTTPHPPELGCLHPRYWTLDSVLDFAVPAAAVIAIAYGATHASV